MSAEQHPEDREHQFVIFTTTYTPNLITVCGATREEAREALPYVISDSDWRQIGEPIPGLDIPEDDQYPFFLNSIDEEYAATFRNMLKTNRKGGAS